MERPLYLAVMCLLLRGGAAQGPAPGTIHSSSTLVMVPALVETASGELMPNLRALDFMVTDNGIEQQVSLEEDDRPPVAVVVLMQTGGAAERQFQNYRGLATMVDNLTGASPRQVALVTFDSEPEEASPFVSDVEDLKEDLTHPKSGDSGAAILDAVGYGIDLLLQQPANTRRILLLLSQPYDDGSKAHSEEIVRRLGETNTTIYSVTFSPEKTWVKDQFTRARQENGPYQMSPGTPAVLHTFNLSEPIGVALRAMRADVAAEIATLSGGEALPFGNRQELDRQLSLLANHIPNRYTLAFRPTSNEPGLHAIQVRVVGQPVPLTVKARESYWSTGAGQ